MPVGNGIVHPLWHAERSGKLEELHEEELMPYLLDFECVY